VQQPLVKRIPFARILIGLALFFLLSLGLCGVTLVVATNGGSSNSQMNQIIAPMGMVVLVGMLGSIAALVLTCIVWAVMSIAAGTAKEVSQPKEIYDKTDDTKQDKRE
jgi:hypothetical protein